MATVTVTEVEGFAHCPDSRCRGNIPVPVAVMRQTTDMSYLDLGGDLPGVERSVEHLRLVDEATDGECPFCPRMRDLSLHDRPQYAALSGYAPDGLLHVKSFDPTVGRGGNDAQVAELMRQVREMSEKLEAREQPASKPAPKVVAKPERTPEQQAAVDERMAKVRAARGKT